MAFEFNPQKLPRVPYSPNNTVIVKVPRPNIFTAMKLLLKGKVSVVTTAATGIPDFQVWRLIKRLEIINDKGTVWTITGKGLAAFFQNRNGVAAAGNTSLTVAVAADKPFQGYLHCAFSPDDAIKPWDFAMDTRPTSYEIHITWADATAAGVLFGTPGGTTVTSNDNIYLDIELDKLTLRPDANGNPDQLSSVTPYMRGLREEPIVVTNNVLQTFDVPNRKKFRNIALLTMEKGTNGEEVGRNTVLTDKILIADTNDHQYQNRQADMVREATSLRLGVGSNLNAGFYMLPMTNFGALTDVVVDDPVSEISVEAAVAKLTGDTTVYAIYDTVETNKSA